MKNIELTQDNLPLIAERITTPTYNRKALKSGIVHVGIGGFHRSHQAYYVHQLLQNSNELEWGICGVGLRKEDRNINDVLKKQDCLYTLITQHPNGEVNSEVIGSINEFLWATESPEAVIDKMAHPDTKIVSLTITEGGYNFNATTEEFNFENPDIQQELEHPDKPITIFGYLTAALRKRRNDGLQPFTVMSCDNIQHNGDMTRKMLLSFAKRQDKDLAVWMEENVTFPNSMVDRITPVTTAASINYLKETHGVQDEWPVICEPFIQWVVEDKFTQGRPPLEKMGVQFVPDVSPYEKMKIRLLNAGHSLLGITGALHGHPTIDTCMNDPVFATFMRQYMDKEVTPILDPLEGVNIEKYKDSLEERFANTNIKDSVGRICSESSAKLPKFLIPTLNENLATGGSIDYATLLLAAWCYYSHIGVSEQGSPLEIIDSSKSALHDAAKETPSDKLAFIRQPEIFGDLINNQRFCEKYAEFVSLIYAEKDIRKVLSKLAE